MKIAVINSGNELLRGTAVNTNLPFLGQVLAAGGREITKSFLIGDDASGFYDALSQSAACADVILVSGGLGSTDDDITRKAVCRFFGLELQENDALRRRLLYLWRVRHGKEKIPKIYFRQAMVPENAEILPNENGSAPGLAFFTQLGGKDLAVCLLPGPPAEFEPMAERLLPAWLDRAEAALCPQREQIYTQGFLAVGVGELALQSIVHETLPESAQIAYCANAEGTRVFATCHTAEEASETLEILRKKVGKRALKPGELSLAPALLQILRERNFTLGGAESCTGGMISSHLVDVPGSSDVFAGSAVVYSNALKQKLLGVPAEILEKSGAVSAPCAQSMLDGVRNVLHTDCAFAVTGIAGPGGGTPEKPVGLVFIGAAIPGETLVKEFHFRGSRTKIRERTAAAALKMLFELLNGIEEENK